MKYAEKRKHLISKILVAIIIAVALFFAVCDCTPKSKEVQTTVVFERN